MKELHLTKRFVLSFAVVILVGLVFAHPQTSSADLIGYWNFGEGSGTTALDSSGNGYHGAHNGDPTYVTGPTGFGTALALDGSGDYVEITGTGAGAHDLNLVDTDYTIAFWLDYTSGARIINMDDGNDTGGGYSIRSQGSAVSLSHFGAPSSFNGSTGQVFSPGWKHYAFVYSNSGDGAIRLYVNGVLSFTSSTGRSPLDSEENDPLWFGGIPAYGQYLNGTLDEVRIYNEALDSNAIQALQVIPEPASAGLIVAGLAMMAPRRSKRKR